MPVSTCSMNTILALPNTRPAGCSPWDGCVSGLTDCGTDLQAMVDPVANARMVRTTRTAPLVGSGLCALVPKAGIIRRGVDELAVFNPALIAKEPRGGGPEAFAPSACYAPPGRDMKSSDCGNHRTDNRGVH